MLHTSIRWERLVDCLQYQFHYLYQYFLEVWAKNVCSMEMNCIENDHYTCHDKDDRYK